ncbi:MAG TPA: phosphoribosyltransferase family protein [Telluria sp.]|jgi:predicted phosphoribosyltransferase
MKAPKIFKDRQHAGKQLAQALADAAPNQGDAIVMALPRGGVPVGYAIAHALALPLDLLLVRKLGLPGHEEFAMGAVGAGGVHWLNDEVVRAFHITRAVIDQACAREWQVIASREHQYRMGRLQPLLSGRNIILVDDGMATGSTMRAAIAVARAKGAAHLTVAVPVGAPDTCRAIRREVDRLICLASPPAFRAVSEWYRHFEQTDDAQVRQLLALAWKNDAQHA